MNQSAQIYFTRSMIGRELCIQVPRKKFLTISQNQKGNMWQQQYMWMQIYIMTKSLAGQLQHVYVL